jgi:hypothetical protein
MTLRGVPDLEGRLSFDRWEFGTVEHNTHPWSFVCPRGRVSWCVLRPPTTLLFGGLFILLPFQRLARPENTLLWGDEDSSAELLGGRIVPMLGAIIQNVIRIRIRCKHTLRPRRLPPVSQDLPGLTDCKSNPRVDFDLPRRFLVVVHFNGLEVPLDRIQKCLGLLLLLLLLFSRHFEGPSLEAASPIGFPFEPIFVCFSKFCVRWLFCFNTVASTFLFVLTSDVFLGLSTDSVIC